VKYRFANLAQARKLIQT